MSYQQTVPPTPAGPGLLLAVGSGSFSTRAAVLAITITGGAVAAVAVVDGGEGFGSVPAITITDTNVSPGSLAAVTATIVNGAIASVAVDTAGSGYHQSTTTAEAAAPDGGIVMVACPFRELRDASAFIVGTPATDEKLSVDAAIVGTQITNVAGNLLAIRRTGASKTADLAFMALFLGR